MAGEVVPHSILTEQQMLQTILRQQNVPGLNERLLIANGDDAAVIQTGSRPLAVSVDSFVEGRHFDFKYFTARQAGAKSIEGALSDIAAMGAEPQFVLINLALGQNRESEFVTALYDGVYERLEAHNALLIGGNISSGTDKLAITVTALGEITKGNALSRGGAKPGDRIFVSGTLGGSHAGLRAFQQGISGYEAAKARHLEPRCRGDLIEFIAPLATALIDVSDGLASELERLASAGNCSITVKLESIPIFRDAVGVAEELKESALQYAFCGGEDYELVLAARCDSERIGTLISCGMSEIGYVGRGSGVFIELNGKSVELKNYLASIGSEGFTGFDHLIG